MSQKQLDNDTLISILNLSNDATAVYGSRELHIRFVSDAMLSIWGKDRSVAGKTFEDAIPEIIGQPFTALLQQVWDTGETFKARDTAADLMINGVLKTSYFDFEYRAIKGPDGITYAILHTAADVTDRRSAYLLLQEKQAHEAALYLELDQSNQELASLNNEMAAINEELQAANEELTVTNEQLLQMESSRQILFDQLSVSESLFKSLFDQAPLGVALLSGPDLVIEQVNPAMLKIWGFDAGELLGKPHLEARPEMTRQAVPELLNKVYQSGLTQVNTEMLVWLKDGNGLREAYVNSIYSPLKDQNGATTGVMIMLDEVTDVIAERRRRETAEEQIRMTIESADLGTWYMEGKTKELVTSPSVKALFGFYPDEHMTFEEALQQVREDFREPVYNAISNAINTGEKYEIEYPVIGFHDQQIRWVKAFGKPYAAAPGRAEHFSGILMDITERKQDEQRKNDFIGIVSHELRSPLTSMNGYVQMLRLRAQKAGDTAILDIAIKAKRQTDRMASLISGFLEMARLNEGKIELQKQFFDMAELVKLAEEESLATITTHRVVFHPVEYTPVFADRDKIEQVLVNFINNAVKYSPENSTINVTCITRDPMAYVSVEDQGMGIPEKDRAHVFDRFYRVEADHMKTIKGFGIGLYICREIILRHGGKIGVESELGTGSKFWFAIKTGLEYEK